MELEEYAAHDGLGLAELVAAGEVSAAELVEVAVEAVERRDGELNAVVHKAYDEARRTAGGALPQGPFTGVPFLVKDLGRAVAGWPSSWGSRYAATPPAAADCVLVRRFREAGLVLLGATNTPEFGIPGVTASAALGRCSNPWNTDHIAGGSSGGASAAVASGMVPVAHGTDGMGSIRIPAACCGLVGMKPTRDRNPNEPGSRAQLRGSIVDSVVSRTVRDSAAMLDATGYPQPASPYAPPPKQRPYLAEVGTPPGRLRITWSSATPFGTAVDPEVDAALAATAEALAGLGHDVREESLGIDWIPMYRAMLDVSAAGFATDMGDIAARVGREPTEDDVEAQAWRLYRRGRELTAIEAFDAFQRIRILSWDVLERFGTFDVHLTPVLATLTPRHEQMDPLEPGLQQFDRQTIESFAYTVPANLTGQPSLSLPLARSASGLPIGIMLTARYGDEGTLFQLAGQLEREIPWHQHRPHVWVGAR